MAKKFFPQARSPLGAAVRVCYSQSIRYLCQTLLENISTAALLFHAGTYISITYCRVGPM